jgi:phage shock protein A
MNTSSAMSAFERMEEKVLMQESRAQALGELAGADLETQFAQLEGGSDVDDELAALKAQMLPPATPVTQAQLPPQQETTPAKSNEVVDAELDSLRKQLDQL